MTGASGPAPRLLLLRHAEVASHRGDIPITPGGRQHAVEAGRRLAAADLGSIRLLCGGTRRARETAEGVRYGLIASGRGVVTGPEVAFALRNPDLYLDGVRVDMVSTPEALAEQVPGVSAGEVRQVPFFAGFLTAPDRIGFWLRSAHPPGDDAAAVAGRIAAFAASLADRGAAAPDTVVALTHSPVLRAVGAGLAGEDDAGEPAYLTGYAVEVLPRGATASRFDPFA